MIRVCLSELLGERPLRLAEELTEAVEDRFAFIEFDTTQQLHTVTDKDIGADVDGLVGEVYVERRGLGAEMHLLEDRLTLMDVRGGDHEIGVPFGIADASQGA